MIDAQSFSAIRYMRNLNSQFDLTTGPGRLAASIDDPLAFALIYLPTIISGDDGRITLSDVHCDWIEQGKRLMIPDPSRDCYVAPRAMGKSTWWFLIFPLWAAAFGYTKYVAAFASAASQAWQHLGNFKRQIDTNETLRNDFPELCEAARRPNGKPVADNEGRYIASNDFIFDADGIDGSVAGKNYKGNRPDFIILDDIEPDEGNYSLLTKDRRLQTVRENIFQINVSARVVISGTVTMPGSIIHELVRSVHEPDPEPWILEEKPVINVHHYLPFVSDDEGNERSVWEANVSRFGYAYMDSIRATAPFLKNYMNSPLGGDGSLWKPEDIKHGEVEGVGGLLLSIDPAVTENKKSDYTGLALLGLSKKAKKIVVVDCWQVKLGADRLAERIIQICNDYPVIRALVETNQGGDVWKTIFKDIPVPLETKHQSERKEVRAARAYVLYTKGQVQHAKALPKLEEQMVSFPDSPNDDMVDAVSSGIAYLTAGLARERAKARMIPASSFNYV